MRWSSAKCARKTRSSVNSLLAVSLNRLCRRQMRVQLSNLKPISSSSLTGEGLNCEVEGRKERRPKIRRLQAQWPNWRLNWRSRVRSPLTRISTRCRVVVRRHLAGTRQSNWFLKVWKALSREKLILIDLLNWTRLKGRTSGNCPTTQITCKQSVSQNLKMMKTMRQ